MDPKMGYIYVMTNMAMPGLVKIGMTARSLDERTRELNRATGVPGRFEVCQSWEIPATRLSESEKHVHRELRSHRHSKEFFKLSSGEAIRLIEAALDKLGLMEILRQQADERRQKWKAEEQKRKAKEEEERRRQLMEKEISEARNQAHNRVMDKHKDGIHSYAMKISSIWGLGIFWGLIWLAGEFDGAAFLFGCAAFVIAYFRSQSKKENEILQSKEMENAKQNAETRIRDKYLYGPIHIKNTTVIDCPKCDQHLRVPKGKQINATCPTCKHDFRFAT